GGAPAPRGRRVRVVVHGRGRRRHPRQHAHDQLHRKRGTGQDRRSHRRGRRAGGPPFLSSCGVWRAVWGGPSPFFFFSQRGTAGPADRALTERIRADRNIPGRVASIARRGRKILAPRLVVVTVAHAVWRQAVHAFAHSSAAVIIDVTIPSESLRWEITTLLPI